MSGYITKRKTIQNISANLFVKLVAYVFSFLTVAYAARVLQPEVYGRVSFVSSFTGYFVMLANLGMPIYAMRVCAEKKDDRKALSMIVNELWSIGIILSVITIVVFIPIVLTVPRLRDDRLLFFIYASTIIFQAFGFEWLYKGLERFRFLAVCQLLSKAISFLCMVLFIHSEEQLPLYAILSVTTGYGANVICLLFLRKHIDLSPVIRFNKRHLKPLFVFAMMSAAVSVYSSLDLTMLGFMKTDLETGLYSVASKGKGVLTIFGGIVWSSLLPQATRLWNEGEKDRFESLAGKAVTIVTAIQLVVTIICFIFARQIVLIIGGESYEGAVTAFRVLLFSLIPIGVSNILGGMVLIPAGAEQNLLYAELAGAAVNFITNLFVIPLYSIEGAAATTVLSELVVTVMCGCFIRKVLQMDFGFSLIRKVGTWAFGFVKRRIIRLNSRIYNNKLPYHCPCCDTYLKSFIEGGYKKAPDRFDRARYEHTEQSVICPVCGALPRHRILALWCDEHRDELQKSKILYFAAERSMLIWMKKHGISCTTADLYSKADLNIDIQDTGLPEGSYDVVICNHVLEHVDNFRKALGELNRILRIGGILICSFPMDPKVELLDEDLDIDTDEGRRKRFGQYDHKRVFGMKADKLLSEAGFSVEAIKGTDYPEKILPVVGPADYDMNILFCCTKRL